MRITRNQLRQVIREELERHLLSEVEITVDAGAQLDDHGKALMVYNAGKWDAGERSQYSSSVNKKSTAYNPQHVLDGGEEKGITPEIAYNKLRAKVVGGIPSGAGKAVYDSEVAALVKKGASQEVAELQAALMNPSGGGRLKGMEGYERELPSALLAMARGR